MRAAVSLWLCVFCALLLPAQQPASRRSFDELFPGLDPAVKAQSFVQEEKGFSRCVTNPADLVIQSSAAKDLFPPSFAAALARGGFSYISENLWVVPYAEGRDITLLDMYNALQKVRGMKDITYHSFTRKKWTPLFEDAFRIDDPIRQKALPDPGYLPAIPERETLFVKLKDINLGSTIYRSELTHTGSALVYTITNHKASSLLFVPVIKPERFVSRIYLEPLEEGVLVYCAACIETAGFVDRMIDMPSALKKRLDVLVEWALAAVRAGSI
jgi:hypothetical protein